MKKRLIALFLIINVMVYLLIIALVHDGPIYASLLSPIITIIIMNLVSKEFRKAYFGKSL